MRRRRTYPRCVHCLVADGVTEDHGVPRSWYPNSSVPNAAKVKAPACRECQERMKVVEEEALVPLALSLDPNDPGACGVPQAAWRSMDPTLARNEIDRRSRIARRNRIRAMAFVPDSSAGALPGCGPEGRSALALPLREKALLTFGEKLTRVVFWSEYQQLIGPDCQIATHIAKRGADELVIASAIRAGRRLDVPPGIRLAVSRASDDPRAGLVVVDLWQRVRLFTSVQPVPAELPAVL